MVIAFANKQIELSQSNWANIAALNRPHALGVILRRLIHLFNY